MKEADASVLTPDVDPAQAPATEPDLPEPDLGKLADWMRHGLAVRSIGITILATLALFYTLYFAREFFRPVVFAILLSFLLSPAVRALRRFHVPAPAGAGLILLALIGALGFGAYELADPVQTWVAEAPSTLAGIRDRLEGLRQPVEQATRTAEQVEKATTGAGSTGAQQVVVREPGGVGGRVLGVAGGLVSGVLETLVLLYFLLAAGDLFLQKLVHVIPQLRDKKTAVQIARETEGSISSYLFTVALINAGLGVAVTLAMWALGMPNPVLWGVLAGLAEFIPYLGAAIVFAVLTLAGLATFPHLGQALLVPAVYMGIDFVQANFVYPTVLGRRMTLNPVAIFIGLLFWFFLWGVPGAFIAVPLLATFKIFCDHIDALAPIGEFLGK